MCYHCELCENKHKKVFVLVYKKSKFITKNASV